jgi:acyl CoA:acetate/3-ketoacid CoA transferase
MIDKRISSVQDAVKDIKDGATILMSGFGGAGSPIELMPIREMAPGLTHDDLQAKTGAPLIRG